MEKTIDEYTRELEIEFPNEITYKLIGMILERNKIIEELKSKLKLDINEIEKNTKLIEDMKKDLSISFERIRGINFNKRY